MIARRENADTVNVLVLRDGAGKPVFDVQCSVSCGDCCGYWYEIPDFAHYRDGKRSSCPKQRKHGCRLKRAQRPEICRAYMCELGMLAHLGMVGAEEIASVVASGSQAVACSTLRKYLPVESEEVLDLAKACPEAMRY